MGRIRRVLVGLAAGSGVLFGSAGVVHADPAGPTDYQTSIISIDPATPAITARVVGGDSFIMLTVQPGTEVVVLGYNGEPYVRFSADGMVEENRRSPTLYQNNSRYGTSDSPADADAAAAPEWKTVGHNGRYAWHDHRAHWMQRQPPPDSERGDVIAEGLIPLQVNGATVNISVHSVWLAEPSRLPVVAGAVVAVFFAMIVLSTRRRLAWVLVAGGAAAAGIGYWQFHSLPTETGPSTMWWLLPAVAATSGLIAIVLGRTLVSFALVLLGGIELAIWVLLRRDNLFRALLPTDAPYWLDRGVTAGAAVAAVFALALGGFALFRLPTDVDD